MIVPKVSVVMSVYNGEKYLRESIESILNQTLSDFEFIIINDGSTDNSLDILKSYKDDRIVIIDQKNTGLGKALNNGINESKGKYIARMDADDISMPERLKLQYEFLEKHPEFLPVGSNVEVIDEDSNYVYTSDQLLNWKEIKDKLPLDPFYHSSAMFLRSAYNKANGYPDIRKSQDTVFFNRMSHSGEFYNLPQALIKYRLTPFAISAYDNYNARRINNVILKIIEKDFYTNNNGVKKEYVDEIEHIMANVKKQSKKYKYHLHLAKKYLWNNYQPRLARQNLIKSFKLKPISIMWMIYYIISFLPEKLILFLYEKFKR